MSADPEIAFFLELQELLAADAERAARLQARATADPAGLAVEAALHVDNVTRDVQRVGEAAVSAPTSAARVVATEQTGQ
eukprot:336532-Chlamydomonas_euryale.AAC.1